MNDSDKELLDSLKVYCPPEIVAKYQHKQQKPRDWVRFYYYKNKKRNIVNAKDIKYDYEVSSTLNYNKDTFYKMTGMSSTDGYFDYYFKLKEHLPNVVVKKSNRNNKTERTKIMSKPTDKKHYDIDENGKFIIKFE